MTKNWLFAHGLANQPRKEHNEVIIEAAGVTRKLMIPTEKLRLGKQNKGKVASSANTTVAKRVSPLLTHPPHQSEKVSPEQPPSPPLVVLDEPIEARPLTERQKVPTWRPKWDVKADASCFEDWEDFPFNLYHGFQLPVDSPRYKGVGLEALMLMQGQQLGQANATYSRMMGAYYRLADQCEDVENRLSTLEKAVATHRNLVEEWGPQLKSAIQNVQQADAERRRAKVAQKTAEEAPKGAKEARKMAEDAKMASDEAIKKERLKTAELEELKNSQAALQEKAAQVEQQMELIQNLSANFRKVIENWAAKETGWKQRSEDYRFSTPRIQSANGC